MGRGSILPRSPERSNKATETLAAEDVTTLASSSSWIYIIQPVDKLPSIDITHTLAGAIVGRRRARSVDQWVIHTASRYNTLWHLLGIAFVAVCLFVFFAKTTLQKTLVSTALVVFIGPVLWIHSASLCWDMLLLAMQTYEFWFIQFINATNFVLWILLFGDVRVLAMLVIGLSCILTVFLDANLHMRLIVLRLFVVGSPAMLFAVLMVTVRLTPDLRTTPVYFGDVALDLMDVLTSGTSAIGYFMIMRVFPNRRHLVSVWIRQPPATELVQCELFFPTCHLVPYEAWLRRRIVVREPRGQVLRVATTQLDLVDRDQLRIIDARDTLLGLRLMFLNDSKIGRGLLVATYVTAIGSLVALGLQPFMPMHTTALKLSSVIALVSTILVFFSHLPHYQRTLLRGIVFEIDAWFVSVHATIVSLGACDAFMWDQRSLLVAVVWLWCHWMIFLDALPPVTRRRLALSRWFILFVNVVLLLCPLWLAYVLFFSANKHTLRNRVILHTKIAHVEMRTEMLSFITSRIFTLWLWMGRFLWRESFRPHDAFKLIKHRVHFAVQRQ